MNLCTFCRQQVNSKKYESINKMLDIRILISFKKPTTDKQLYLCPLCLRKLLRDLVHQLDEVK